MGWMQHTCRQAAELMSLRRDEPLGPWRALTLKLHLRVCGDCQQVERQLDQLGRMSSSSWRGAEARADDDDPQR
jgi:Putative zinc-finger